MQRTLLIAVAAVAALFAVANTASAQAIITNGSGIYLGVNPLGNLNVADGTGGISLTPTNSGYIGLYYAGIDGDATSPGCLCEGFGVAGNGISGYAGIEIGGYVNLSQTSFASTAATATSIVTLTSLPDLQVTQQFQPSASTALMENVVTITNLGTEAITDVRYNRTMDWDIPPTTFDEYTTVQGWPAANLLYTSDNGFSIPDPMALPSGMYAAENVNFYHSGPADHGAFFTFAFGNLDPGESIDFSIFYGAASSESAALAALGAVGAEVYSFGQPNPAAISGAVFPIGEPVTFIFGFSGVGGTPVPPPTIPEPSSILLMGSGLLALGFAIRRKRS